MEEGCGGRQRFLLCLSVLLNPGGSSLMQHGECISTAVRVMDSTAATCIMAASPDEREHVCAPVTERGVAWGGRELRPIAGVIKFVSRTHSVSPGCSSLIHNRC